MAIVGADSENPCDRKNAARDQFDIVRPVIDQEMGVHEDRRTVFGCVLEIGDAPVRRIFDVRQDEEIAHLVQRICRQRDMIHARAGTPPAIPREQIILLLGDDLRPKIIRMHAIDLNLDVRKPLGEHLHHGAVGRIRIGCQVEALPLRLGNYLGPFGWRIGEGHGNAGSTHRIGRKAAGDAADEVPSRKHGNLLCRRSCGQVRDAATGRATEKTGNGREDTTRRHTRSPDFFRRTPSA